MEKSNPAIFTQRDAVKAVSDRGVSIAMACRTFQSSESCYRYERKLADENAEIADWLEKLTDNRRTWGLWSMFSVSTERERLWLES